MSGSALPHSAIIAQHFEQFLTDVYDEIGKYSKTTKKSPVLRGIFKNSLAAFTAIEQFSLGELPLLRCAVGATRRIPMLLACRQLSLAYVELRRFVELASWYPYFREHPIEWDEFYSHPEVGIVRDTVQPIRFAAHRDMAWHHAYILARFSGLPGIETAVSVLGTEFAALSTHVHAAFPSLDGSMEMPFDKIGDAELRVFQDKQRIVLSAGCLVVAAAKPASVAKLPAVEKAWFFWCFGSA